MTDTFNAGVEAAAKVMEDLDHSGWFAAAIRARAKRDIIDESKSDASIIH